MSDVLITAIIPTYNRRELTLRAVRSVLAQTQTVDEIIVVDDGSTDGTQAALQAAFGERVRCVWQPNGGVSRARNHGLRLARGSFIALLDSDDEWEPEKCARQLQWLQARPDFGMVVCNNIAVDPRTGQQIRRDRRLSLPEDGMVLKWVLREPALTPSTVMLRREVVETVGEFDESLPTAEDLDYHLRIAMRFKIGLLEEALVWSKEQPDSLSTLSRSIEDHLQVVQRYHQASAGQLSWADRQHGLFRAHRRNAFSMVYAMQWQRAAAHGAAAWRCAPNWSVRLELYAVVKAALLRGLAAGRRSLFGARPVK